MSQWMETATLVTPLLENCHPWATAAEEVERVVQ